MPQFIVENATAKTIVLSLPLWHNNKFWKMTPTSELYTINSAIKMARKALFPPPFQLAVDNWLINSDQTLISNSSLYLC